jgi:hypothetical protein
MAKRFEEGKAIGNLISLKLVQSVGLLLLAVTKLNFGIPSLYDLDPSWKGLSESLLPRSPRSVLQALVRDWIMQTYAKSPTISVTIVELSK